MKLSYFPQIKTVHTSKVFYGQLYIPMANWLLMIGTVIVTAVYNNVRFIRPQHHPTNNSCRQPSWVTPTESVSFSSRSSQPQWLQWWP